MTTYRIDWDLVNKLQDQLQSKFRGHRKNVRNGFVGRMNSYSDFLSRDQRGRVIDLDRDQWSRVYNSYEGSGQ